MTKKVLVVVLSAVALLIGLSRLVRYFLPKQAPTISPTTPDPICVAYIGNRVAVDNDGTGLDNNGANSPGGISSGQGLAL